jgi:hypothetical protein
MISTISWRFRRGGGNGPALRRHVRRYGVRDRRLYLKSIPDRVNAMISIAHPDFREALRREAIAVGLIVR